MTSAKSFVYSFVYLFLLLPSANAAVDIPEHPLGATSCGLFANRDCFIVPIFHSAHISDADWGLCGACVGLVWGLCGACVGLVCLRH